MVAAIVVLYHPNLDAVHRLIKSLEGQLDAIFVIDNTPLPEITPESELFPSNCSVPRCYTSVGKNIGIAAAQNSGISQALDKGASHVILFDQDSAPAHGMIEALLSAESALEAQGLPLAAVGPVFVDERTSKVSPAVRYSFLGLRTTPIDLSKRDAVEAHFLIASGTLIRASILKSVGLMREDLFIDWVDNEWGLRARYMGLRCYMIPGARMGHSIGDGVVRLLWKHMHLHTEARNYYLLRNAIYLMRVRTMGIRWKLSFLPRLPFYLMLYPLLSKNRLRHVVTLLRAISDGLSGRMGSMSRS